MADDKKVIFSMVNVSKSFTPTKQVLKNIYLSFFYGAKIGIIGLNGSGKSTLLKIIAGVDKSFDGEVVFSPGYSVGYLEQEPKFDEDKTVIEVVREGAQKGMARERIRQHKVSRFAVSPGEFVSSCHYTPVLSSSNSKNYEIGRASCRERV